MNSHRKLRPLAEQGDALAQYNLGVMCANGRGVPQDDAEALKWYRLAANQGNAMAQYNLGIMYMKATSVAQDFVQAFVWFSLAAGQGDGDASKALAYVTEIMSPEQETEAESQVREWVPE